MATKPRENSARVLSGDAPGGVPEIIFKQLGVLLAIVFLYISLWMILDDSAKLPGTKVQPPHAIPQPVGYMHEVTWTPELKAIREAEAKKLDSWDAGKIPVEKAMALIVQRGLPTKVLPEAQQQLDLAKSSTEGNGGQVQWLEGAQAPATHEAAAEAPVAAHAGHEAAAPAEAHGAAPAPKAEAGQPAEAPKAPEHH